MWYGRVRTLGSKPESTEYVFGSQVMPVPQFEEIWEIAMRRLKHHYNQPMPQAPSHPAALRLLRHIGKNTPGYICSVQSTAVWAYVFVNFEQHETPVIKVLEVWDGDSEFLYPEKHWENNELLWLRK